MPSVTVYCTSVRSVFVVTVGLPFVLQSHPESHRLFWLQRVYDRDYKKIELSRVGERKKKRGLCRVSRKMGRLPASSLFLPLARLYYTPLRTLLYSPCYGIPLIPRERLARFPVLCYKIKGYWDIYFQAA